MAIAIRGTTPATQSGTGDPTSLTLTGTRQPQTDDVLIIIHGNDFYALSNMPTPTVGGSTTGVTAITNGDADGGVNSAHARSHYYVAGSTGDLTVAVDETGTADEEKCLVVYVLSGVDTATPIDVAGNAQNVSADPHVCPSISPTSTDAFLICHVNTGGGNSAGSYTPPGSMTEQYDTDVGAAFTFTGGTEQLSASGATGTRTFDPVTSSQNCELSIAVKTGGAAPPSAPNRIATILQGAVGRSFE
jgi:hypothetical protein